MVQKSTGNLSLHARRLCCALTLLLIVASVIQSTSQATNAQKNSRAQKQSKPGPATDELGQAPPIPKLIKKKEEPQREPEVSPGDVISVTTSEVMIPVTVRDNEGRLVNDLTRNDFRVFEDGTPQPLSDLALRQVPVDVALMVDASSSVASNIEDFRIAAEGFAGRLAAEDRLSLIKFDDRVELLLDWTKSRYQLHRALTRIQGGMFTRFNDALLLAARDQFPTTAKSRKAVIVLTDGIDHGSSTTTLEHAIQSLLQAQVTVYVVSNTQIARAEKLTELDSLTSLPTNNLNPATAFDRNEQIKGLRARISALDESEDNLAQLTAATGGRLFKPTTFSALESTYAEVADELRHQYALYYTPLNKSRDGAFRRVKVQTANPSFKSQTRVGYFAPKS